MEQKSKWWRFFSDAPGGRYFVATIAAILLFAAVSKIISLPPSFSVRTSVDDPVLMMPVQYALLGTAILELATAVYLLLGQNTQLRYGLVAWLGAIFILYRIAKWWEVGTVEPCNCLGATSESLGLEPTTADSLSKTLAISMFLGGLVFLVRDSVAAAYVRIGNIWRRRLKWAFLTAGLLLLFPLFQVGCVAVSNPRITAPIVLRQAQGILCANRASIHYQWVGFDDVPQDFYQALLIAEDEQFFKHHGFDWVSIRSEIKRAAVTGQSPRGASTITQQCARSLFLWQGRSWIRKGVEAYYTVWMELLLSKKRILELYANSIEFGDGIYGIEAGAQYHYGISAQQLNPRQVAMLVAIMPSPKNWNPKQPNKWVVSRYEMILNDKTESSLPSQRMK